MGYLGAMRALSRQRHADLESRWTFEVNRAAAPARVAWHWERLGADGVLERSAATFPSFAECARDAQGHGFGEGSTYTLRDRPSVPATAWAGSPRR